MNHRLHLGDNLATLKTYPDNHFDSIVTDPPYGIEFLGKEWDQHTGELELWQECLRVLKPGGYLLAFSAARTYHRLASNIELAGFEIRDQLMWLYSSGFPKAQDIGKAIDKRAGNANNLKRHDSDKKDNNGLDLGSGVKCPSCMKDSAMRYSCDKGNDCGMVYKPATAEGAQWNGFKTALKPAHEPIVMARKPFKGSTVDNVLKNGLGAMNIDATRVPWADEADETFVENTTWNHNQQYLPTELHHIGTKKKKKSDRSVASGGRAVKGVFVGGGHNIPNTEDQALYETNDGGRYPSNVIGEVEEGYQKYFMCPKVSRNERHVGFDMPEALTGHIKGCYADDGQQMAVGLDAAEGYRGNNHPTVKPVALMDYLIKLVTPLSTPELQRKILDPFMGSGSTGMAATKLGHHFTGCELDPKYVEIAETRINAWNTLAEEEEIAIQVQSKFDELFG